MNDGGSSEVRCCGGCRTRVQRREGGALRRVTGAGSVADAVVLLLRSGARWYKDETRP